MNELTGETLQDAAETVVDTADPSEAIENKEDAQDTDQAEVSNPEDKSEPEKVVDNPLVKRIERQRAALSAQNRQIAELKAQLEAVKAPLQAEQGAPKESDFDNVEDYYKAMGKWEALQEQTTRQKEEQIRRAKEAQAQAVKQRQEVFEKREADFKKTVPDYDDAVDTVQEAISLVDTNTLEFKAFSDALIASDDMPALLYHLGKNPDDLEAMFKMNPTQIIRHLAKLEDKLQSQAPETTTKKVAPPPSTVRQSSVSGSKRLESLSADELVKWARS